MESARDDEHFKRCSTGHWLLNIWMKWTTTKKKINELMLARKYNMQQQQRPTESKKGTEETENSTQHKKMIPKTIDSSDKYPGTHHRLRVHVRAAAKQPTATNKKLCWYKCTWEHLQWQWNYFSSCVFTCCKRWMVRSFQFEHFTSSSLSQQILSSVRLVIKIIYRRMNDDFKWRRKKLTVICPQVDRLSRLITPPTVWWE